MERNQRRELLDVAQRLTHDFDEMTAGSVLRCYSRAVQFARVHRAAHQNVAHQAEEQARAWLNARRAPAA